MAAATLPQVLTAASAAAITAAGLSNDLDKAMRLHWADYPTAHHAIYKIVATILANDLANVTLWVTLRDQT